MTVLWLVFIDVAMSSSITLEGNKKQEEQDSTLDKRELSGEVSRLLEMRLVIFFFLKGDGRGEG